MSEVRRHQRRTASGKTVTVKRHERGTGAAAERKREAWEDRAAQRWTPPLRPETAEAPAVDEGWWDDDEPRPEAWTDNDGTVEHDGHTFKVNRAPAYRPQGDYDFAEPEPSNLEMFHARAAASRQMFDAQHRYDDAKTLSEREVAERDIAAARTRLRPFGGYNGTAS